LIFIKVQYFYEKSNSLVRKELRIVFYVFRALKEIQSEILIDTILPDTSHVECVAIQDQAQKFISQE